MTTAMTLLIDGTARVFIPLTVARAALDLPADFGVSLFEPKDYAGLGSIDGAGDVLHELRAAVLAADRALIDADPLARCDALTSIFERELRRINPVIGLREPEIGFAVSGFSDVLRAWAYARIQAAALRSDPPSFAAVYGRWLHDTVRISATVHRFAYRQQVWKVQIVTHAYGRFGLIMEDEAGRITGIYDPRLACPAEGFMMRLLEAICTTHDSAAPARSAEWDE